MDQVIRAHPLDPVLALVYVVAFIAAALAGMHRPAYGVAALIFAQPFALYSDVFHTTITLSKVITFGLALGLICRPQVFQRLRERPAKQLVLAGLLVAAATAITILVASHRMAVLRETAKALEYVAIFCVTYCAYRAEQNANLVRRILVGTIFLVVLGALMQEIIGAPSGLYIHNHPIPRIAGPLEGPNQLAGFLDIAIALLLAFEIQAASVPTVLTLTLAVAADALTFSRGGYVGAAASIIAVFLIYRRAPGLTLLGIGVGVALGAAVIGGWEMAAREAPKVGGYANSGSTVFRIEGISKSSYAGGVGSRSELWHAAFKLWRAHPILGVGAGNFELDLPQAGLHGIRTHANSLYVQSVVEGGVLLLAATLWLICSSIRNLARGAARSPLIAGAVAGTVGLAIHQIGDLLTFYPKVGGWWWLVLALGAAEILRGKPESNSHAKM